MLFDNVTEVAEFFADVTGVVKKFADVTSFAFANVTTIVSQISFDEVTANRLVDVGKGLKQTKTCLNVCTVKLLYFFQTYCRDP